MNTVNFCLYFTIQYILALQLALYNNVTSTPTQFFFEPVKLGNKIVNLFKVFKNCHFKYFTEHGVFDIPLAIIISSRENAVYSHETFQFGNNSVMISRKYRYHRTKRFSQCFIHCYIVDDFNNHLTYKLYQSASAGESPNHFLYFTNQLQDLESRVRQDYFFTRSLPRTFAMGYILHIRNLSSIFMVCLACKENPFHVLSDINDLSTLQRKWFELYSNLRGIHIEQLNYYYDVYRFPKYSCEFFRELVPTKTENLGMDVCTHKLLGKKLNYTVGSPPNRVTESSRTYTDGEALQSSYICENNYYLLKQSRLLPWEWVSYSISYLTFQFVTILPKPGFNATALIEPFDFTTWIIFLICCVLLILITFPTFRIRRMVLIEYTGEGVKISEIIIGVLGSILDQPMLQMFHKYPMISIPPICFTSLSWFIWLTMLIILGQVYKGKIFSFLTMSTEPIWPNTLNELIEPSEMYTLITLTSGITGGVQYSLLKDQMKEYQADIKKGKAMGNLNLYSKLENDLNYFHHDWYDLALAVYSNSLDEVNRYKPSNVSFRIPVSNLVILDYSQIVKLLSVVIPSFVPSNVVSKPIPLKGFDIIIPWRVQKSYFFPIFINHLQLFYESGLHDKIKRYSRLVSNYKLLKRLNALLKLNFSSSAILSRSQLYYLSLYDVDYMKPSAVLSSPLSFKMLEAVFLLSALLLTTGLAIFLIEYLKKQCNDDLF